MKKGKYNKNLAALIIVVIISGAVITSHLSGLLDFVEFKTYDFRINLLAQSRQRSQDITLVLLTQDCLEWAQKERGWGWPWPRQSYAEFVDYMNAGKAKSVIFDVLFSEPSIYRNARQDEIIESTVRTLQTAQTAVVGGNSGSAYPMFSNALTNLQTLSTREDDASFAKAMENCGNVVQGIFFSSQWGSVDTWPHGLEKPIFQAENFGQAISRFAISNEDGRTGAQFPIEEIRNAASVLGTVTGDQDSDEIFRRVRLFTFFDGKAVPGLSAAALLASGYDEKISYDSAKRVISWGDYSIPVDHDGKTLLRFRGPLEQYPVYHMSDVLQSAEAYAAGREPLLYPEDFAGSNVFFGFYAPGLFDICSSPVSSVYAGMGMHVTMLDNLLMGDFIREAPTWIAVLVIAAAVLLVVGLVLFTGRISFSVAGLLIGILALIFAGFFAFYFGLWIPLAAPIIAALLAYLTATLYSYATEGKDKRFIKGAFSRILSPKVIDQIIADPSQLKLGGERRTMTAIFTDIQRFSSISSELEEQYGDDGPKVLVNLLNLYFTEMSNIILANGGTIDKYEGDAIIAFFGAPIWDEKHAAMACRSAILMKKKEYELRDMVMKPDGEFYVTLKNLIDANVIPDDRPIYTRLGINTGEMVVGFMGTPSKMDYTIMGNAVNLSSRLEGVNKQYNTHGILISEYTRDIIGDEFIVRPLSRVTVVGIPVPLRLYELLEIKANASPEMLNMLGVWDMAFKAYEGRDFTAAKKYFAEVYEKDPTDRPAKLYLDRCEEYIAEPPSADWDGVDNLTEK